MKKRFTQEEIIRNAIRITREEEERIKAILDKPIDLSFLDEPFPKVLPDEARQVSNP